MDENHHYGLIPGLPDDISKQCLVRVPLMSHSTLKSVCRAWRDLVDSSTLHHLRAQSGTTEPLVYLIQNNNAVKTESRTETNKNSWLPECSLNLFQPLSATWRSVVSVPLFSQCVSVPTTGDLVLFGGWDPNTLVPTTDVHVISAASGRCRRGSSMTTARTFFAATVVGHHVYVVGGHDGHKNALASGEVYDVKADEWRPIPTMAGERDECAGVTVDGEVWVISGYQTEEQGKFGLGSEIFDPVKQSWKQVDGFWGDAGGECSPRSTCFVVEKKIWRVECKGRGRGVRVWDGEQWIAVAELPEDLRSSPCTSVVGETEVLVMGCDRELRWRGWMLDCRTKKWSSVKTPDEFSGAVYSAAAFQV